MKLNLAIQELGPEVDAKYIRLSLPVRYDEEDMPNDFPGRTGNMWDVIIDLETGILEPHGKACDLYMKVTDEGIYTLHDANNNPVAIVEEDYVPHGIVPGDYGDYVELSFDENGKISNWPEAKDLNAAQFQPTTTCDQYPIQCQSDRVQLAKRIANEIIAIYEKHGTKDRRKAAKPKTNQKGEIYGRKN